MSICNNEGVSTSTMLVEGHQPFFEINRLTYLYGLILEVKKHCKDAASPVLAKKPRLAASPPATAATAPLPTVVEAMRPSDEKVCETLVVSEACG